MSQAAGSTADNRLHIAIVGSGAAGRACAIQALECGARVTMIEHRDLGGSLISIGSIPVKHLPDSLADSSEASPPTTQGIQWLMQQRERLASLRQTECEVLVNHPDLTLMLGEARFLEKQKLIVRLNDDSRKVSFRKIVFARCLIATGDIPDIPQIVGLGATPYWTSTEALSSPIIPSRLAVIGGSAIAVELAQTFARLGSQVTLLHEQSQLFPDAPLLGKTLTQVLRADGITVLDGVSASETNFEEGVFMLSTNQGGIQAERLLIAGERSPNTHSLCADMIGVELDARGCVCVDNQLQTNVVGIYAAGACTTLPSLAEGAGASGRLAAINMTGGTSLFDLSAEPFVVLTDPPAASVGVSEEVARSQGFATVSQTLPLTQSDGKTCCFIKIVAQSKTLRVLGVQVVAAEASELIQAAAYALRAQMTVQDMAERQFSPSIRGAELHLCARLFVRDFDETSLSHKEVAL